MFFGNPGAVELADYEWSLNALQDMFPPGFGLPVISTDKDIALGNAIASVLPGTIYILSVWHIEENVLMRAKSHFATQEEVDTLLA
ncbi:hypothetical protein PsorP6_007103 [Peronosclerospora sorghi]|uniref:Uncharacterized protein n=1 Tax=Peronosclerospora sorghi TaxID=230839 RepID=A0ACC0WBD7_9STRA|nr:hypothetical protein PsorP6_007103 [Peronosclerospora sorghi]